MKVKSLIVLPLILTVGILIGHLMQVLANPGIVTNPGHSVNQVGAGTFAEQGDYVFPGSSRVGIGTTPTEKLEISGNVRASGFFTQSQTCPSGWYCQVNTWDIVAQSEKLYAALDVSTWASIGGQLTLGNTINFNHAGWLLTSYGNEVLTVNDQSSGQLFLVHGNEIDLAKTGNVNTNTINLKANNVNVNGNLNVKGSAQVRTVAGSGSMTGLLSYGNVQYCSIEFANGHSTVYFSINGLNNDMYCTDGRSCNFILWSNSSSSIGDISTGTYIQTAGGYWKAESMISSGGGSVQNRAGTNGDGTGQEITNSNTGQCTLTDEGCSGGNCWTLNAIGTNRCYLQVCMTL